MLNLPKIEPEVFIHIADKRQKTSTGFLTSSNVQNIQDIHLEPFAKFSFKKEVNETVFVLPFLGDLNLIGSNFETKLEENKGQFIRKVAETSFEITNKYETEPINFLYVNFFEKHIYAPFDSVLLKTENKIDEWQILGSDIFLGQWSAKEKASFDSNTNENYLIYCLSGAFEVENRLLEAKDSLEIINAKGFTFKALAGHSILIMFKKSI